MIKRLSGGLILLCLTSISLGVTSGEVSITDTDVLEQLKELRTFIDVNRDFSKGFKNLKPVLIEYRSSASKFNGIALGNLSFNTDALHMSIGINTIQADGKMLIVTINVVYEWEDYVGYKVKSAKLTAYETLATGDGTFTGDVGVGGDLEVTGSINGEENPSVKPIYYHPCYVYAELNHAVKGRFTFVILDNNSTAYTLTTGIAKIKELMDIGALIQCNGFIIHDAKYYNVYMMLKSEDHYYVYANSDSDEVTNVLDLDEIGLSYFSDGVNKIN